MKVIGTINSELYLMQVSHSEIEKFMKLYYGKISKLKVGEEIDLGRGYDFSREIADSMVKTQDFIKANKEIIESILNGISVLNQTEEAEGK